MNPVCDQGLPFQPGGVELVGAIVTPEPDQNQPRKMEEKQLHFQTFLARIKFASSTTYLENLISNLP